MHSYVFTREMANSIAISTTVSREFHDLAKQNNISWSEALRVGLSILFGDKGLKEYDNNINLFRKMNAFRQQAEEALQKLSELEKKHEEDL